MTAQLAGKAVLGAIAGAIIGVVALCLFGQIEPPVAWEVLLAAACSGGFLGAVVVSLAGNRAVSPFWLYLVLVFGAITITPWWWYEKTHAYLPLGAVYVNSRNASVVLMVLIPHVVISVVLAFVITVIHWKRGVGSAEHARSVHCHGPLAYSPAMNIIAIARGI
jgi:hypothetical protein